MGHDIVAAVAAASFWIFIAICAVASIVASTLRHHDTQKTIREAIAKGQALDAATLDRLVQAGRPPKGPPPRKGLLFGGIMMLAIAGGLVIIGWAMSQTDPRQIYQGLGVGGMVGLIGVGLLVAARVIGRSDGDGPE